MKNECESGFYRNERDKIADEDDRLLLKKSMGKNECNENADAG